MSNLILVINPGSTSTKVALFQDDHPLFAKEIGACASVLEGKVDAIVLTGEEHARIY